MSALHRLDIVVCEEDFALAQALVARRVSCGWQEESRPSGETLFRVHSPTPEVVDELARDVSSLLPGARLERGEVEEQNWMDAWKDFFTPVRAGAFLILPPWSGEEPGDALPIRIEPKSAFGTGHHPTTTLCLAALTRLRDAGKLRSGQRFLDLGTGTGILGIACTAFGLHGLGLDIDPLAVDNARENIQLNQCGADFEVRQGSVDAVAGERFDVVIANILAAPLRDMAAQIMALVRPGGCLVLSGFLAVQIPGLKAAYAAMGPAAALRAPSLSTDPTLEGKAEEDEWISLFWPDLPEVHSLS